MATYNSMPLTRRADFSDNYLDMSAYGAPAMFNQTQMPFTPQMGTGGSAFIKRPDNLSAGVAGLGDYLQGAGTAIGSGDWMGGLKDIGAGVGSIFKDSGFLGSTDTATGIKTDGWGGAALGVANGLMSGYMGMKQYGLQKDILANNKAQFERNFGAQKGITNASLQDRQERRVREASANGNNSATSVAEYMSKYGVK